MTKKLEKFIIDLLNSLHLPSAHELLNLVEQKIGLEARWDLQDVVSRLAKDPTLTRANREYLLFLINSGDLTEALAGKGKSDRHIDSTIDDLLRQSILYRSSKAFQEMIDFMGRFRDYSPYNNMLVKVQNPSCGFYATKKDWRKKFRRTLKEDARPMLILAPMHPVMLVYDLDQTEGKQLPSELNAFASFEGDWKSAWMSNTIENAERHRIRIDFKPLSSTHGGFATITRGIDSSKMRIAVHKELDEPSRFGVLCHELAHIFLGHLGADEDNWWPSRSNLDRAIVEVEAEAVAFIVTNHLGLKGNSAAYFSRYLFGDKIPPEVSFDSIAKVSGKIERMATELIPAPKVKKRP